MKCKNVQSAQTAIHLKGNIMPGFLEEQQEKIPPVLGAVHGLGCCPRLQPTPRVSASGDGIRLS